VETHASILAAEGWIELGNFDEAANELHNAPHALWVLIYAARNR
jgi:hypothetical protein